MAPFCCKMFVCALFTHIQHLKWRKEMKVDTILDDWKPPEVVKREYFAYIVERFYLILLYRLKSEMSISDFLLNCFLLFLVMSFCYSFCEFVDVIFCVSRCLKNTCQGDGSDKTETATQSCMSFLEVLTQKVKWMFRPMYIMLASSTTINPGNVTYNSYN